MTVYVAWQQSGSYPASVDRLALAAHMAKVMSPMVVRGGVIIAPGDPLKALPGGAMVINVNSGQAVVSNYTVTSDSISSVTLAGGGASARTDAIILRVRDLEAGDGSSYGAVEAVQGTTTAWPPIPGNSVVLAYVNVGAGASSISGTDITDYRSITVSAGGIIPYAGIIAAGPVGILGDGQAVFDTQTNQLAIVKGGVFKLYPSLDQQIVPPDFPAPYHFEVPASAPVNIGVPGTATGLSPFFSIPVKPWAQALIVTTYTIVTTGNTGGDIVQLSHRFNGVEYHAMRGPAAQSLSLTSNYLLPANTPMSVQAVATKNAGTMTVSFAADGKYNYTTVDAIPQAAV